jgi:hypothetical protein
LKNKLELKKWTNTNQEFSQGTNITQVGPQRNIEDISKINVISKICFHLYCMGNAIENISSEKHFENSKID